MRTSTTDHTRPRPESAGPTRRRRLVVSLVVVAALAAVGTGIAVALAVRPAPTAATGPPAGGPQNVATPTTTSPQSSGQDQPGSGPGNGGHAPVLADGGYDGFVRSVDVGGRTIVVDLVQVFEGQDAFKAAREDGKYAEEPSPGIWLPEWYVRNQNPLLRTLPVARDVRIQFRGSCEEFPAGPPALSELGRRSAHFKEAFYYHFRVEDGLVRSMQEKLTAPAC